MQTKLPNVSSRYGAPMGRRGDRPFPPVGRVWLRRVPLDSGGYDSGGAYWGIGQPLYWAQWYTGTDEEHREMFFRAWGREDAKDIVREAMPGARFFN
jgi:hypothetical protein